jgi:hypothetical protein
MKMIKVTVKVVACMLSCTLCIAAKPESKPMKVYLLAGQSNMTGMVKTNTS